MKVIRNIVMSILCISFLILYSTSFCCQGRSDELARKFLEGYQGIAWSHTLI